MRRAGRIAVVTTGLVAAGFLFGALAGGASFTAVGLLAGQGISSEAFGIAAFFGAPIGAITAPLFAWLLLRRVPLGRMFVICSIGTAIGGIVGWFTMSRDADVLVNPLVGAFVGCLIAAVALSRRAAEHAT